MELDVSSLRSVRAFAKAWDLKDKPVHILINNAGIFSMSAPRTETMDGFEAHIGTNYLGHFLLTKLLEPSLLEGRKQTGNPSRVVNVSSRLQLMGKMHTDDPNLTYSFNSLDAYAQSKLAQVLFAHEYSKRMHGAIRCISIHPGEVLTDVVRSLPGAVQWLYRLVMRTILLTPDQGMSLSICSSMSVRPE